MSGAGGLALLCPGQGGQHAAMFALARTDPQAAALLDQWIPAARLDAPLAAVLADPDKLFANQAAQPLIVAATLATWEALRHDIPAPMLAAGYSIGELAAYGVAGALTPVDTIALATQRARLMDDCLQAAPHQALAAVSGLPLRAAETLLRQCGFYVAIETGEDTLITGGLAARLVELRDAMAAAGGRVNVLPVAVASHTPLMRPAVAPFADVLRRASFGDPAIPVLSGISAQPVWQRDTAIDHLSRQLAETVVWKDCMDAFAEAGITVALELGPGAALARMLHARHPHLACRSAADFRSLDGIRRWLASHVE